MISSHALDLNVEIHSRARTRVREGLPKVQNLDNHRQAGCPLHSIFTASPAHLRLQKGQPHTEVLGGKLHTRASLVAPRVKRLPAAQETRVRSPGQEDPRVRKIPLEKEMATHSSILAWRIPWMEEPGGLQSTGLQKVRHH